MNVSDYCKKEHLKIPFTADWAGIYRLYGIRILFRGCPALLKEEFTDYCLEEIKTLRVGESGYIAELARDIADSGYDQAQLISLLAARAIGAKYNFKEQRIFDKRLKTVVLRLCAKYA